MTRFNTIPGMKPGRGQNEAVRYSNALKTSKKKLMDEVIPPNSDPVVKTIVSTAMNSILEYHQVINSDPANYESVRAGMTKEQAELFIATIHSKLDEAVSQVTFLK